VRRRASAPPRSSIWPSSTSWICAVRSPAACSPSSARTSSRSSPQVATPAAGARHSRAAGGRRTARCRSSTATPASAAQSSISRAPISAASSKGRSFSASPKAIMLLGKPGSTSRPVRADGPRRRVERVAEPAALHVLRHQRLDLHERGDLRRRSQRTSRPQFARVRTCIYGRRDSGSRCRHDADALSSFRA
jgi:hypothetical protein